MSHLVAQEVRFKVSYVARARRLVQSYDEVWLVTTVIGYSNLPAAEVICKSLRVALSPLVYRFGVTQIPLDNVTFGELVHRVRAMGDVKLFVWFERWLVCARITHRSYRKKRTRRPVKT